MSIVVTKNFGRNLSMLTLASLLLYAAAISVNQSFAMGQAPSTCSNRYDGVITDFTITAGHRTYNPIAYPDMTLRIKDTESYNVTFTILTPSQSSDGNSLNGTTWYDTSSTGYQMGECVPAGSNQRVTLTFAESHPSNLAPSSLQNVSWHTLAPGQVTYNVNWVSP